MNEIDQYDQADIDSLEEHEVVDLLKGMAASQAETNDAVIATLLNINTRLSQIEELIASVEYEDYLLDQQRLN